MFDHVYYRQTYSRHGLVFPKGKTHSANCSSDSPEAQTCIFRICICVFFIVFVFVFVNPTPLIALLTHLKPQTCIFRFGFGGN